jgi:hypothetical protein
MFKRLMTTPPFIFLVGCFVHSYSLVWGGGGGWLRCKFTLERRLIEWNRVDGARNL